MEQNSQIDILENQIRECYGRVVWTHKTHEKCADLLFKKEANIKIYQIVLTAISSTGMLVTIFGKSNLVGILSVVLSAISLGLSIYTKDYNIGAMAQKHIMMLNSLWNIRESYLSLLTDIRARTIGINEIVPKRDMLQKELNAIYANSPRTNLKAYKHATKALKHNEELTFSNNEIDMLLPTKLRMNKSINSD